jgi:hypothetical protein
MTRTLTRGLLMNARNAFPGVTIPEGSAHVERQRIICRPKMELSYRVETRIVAPDGPLIAQQSYDADVERKKAEERYLDRIALPAAGYFPNQYSLVCWAAARKCEDKDFTWPPPPNETPLEYSERATKMRADYNTWFIPRCRLPDRGRSE